MHPSLTMKHLYAAFAENPSCGASYYEDAMKCGGSAESTANNGGIAKKKTFDGSQEVGILPDREVFGPTWSEGSPSRKKSSSPSPSSSPPRKLGARASTPDTSPESSVDLNSKEGGSVSSGENNDEGRGPSMPSLDVHQVEGEGNNSLIMKNGSFQSATSHNTTGIDSIERARGVTFRDTSKKRIPKSVNATVSKSSSTLSREEENKSLCSLPSFSKQNSNSNNSSCLNGGRLSHCPSDESSLKPSPTDIKFVYGTGGTNNTPKENKTSSSKSSIAKTPVSPSNSSTNLVTKDMFSKEDVDAITSLQITTYLTVDERKKIGTKILTSKLRKGGYNLASGRQHQKHSSVCDTCNLPMLSKSGKLVEPCVICPVLKKKVLKKILEGANIIIPNSPSSSGSFSYSSTTAASTTMGNSVDLTLGSDMSDSKVDGRDLIAPIENGALLSTKNVTFADDQAPMFRDGNINANLSTDGWPWDNDSINQVANHQQAMNRGSNSNNSFLVEAKKSLVDVFKTKSYYGALKSSFDTSFNCQQLIDESDIIKDGDNNNGENSEQATEHQQAGEVLAKTCHETTADFEKSKNAMAYAGEMMVKKVALVPEALKYKDVAMNCTGEGLTDIWKENATCSMQAAECKVGENELVAESSDASAKKECTGGGLTHDIGALLDQDEIVVEDASQDAEDDPLNKEEAGKEVEGNNEDACADAETEGASKMELQAKINDVTAPNHPSSHTTKEEEAVTNEKAQVVVSGEETTTTCGKTEEQPPLASVSTTSRSNVISVENLTSLQSPAESNEQTSSGVSPSNSVVSALGSTTGSNAAQSNVSNTLNTILERIEQTRDKMLKTEDVAEQIQCAELLAKLSKAAVALKQLEEVA